MITSGPRRAATGLLSLFASHLEHVSAGGERTSTRTGEREVDGIFGQLVEVLTEKQRAIFVLRELEGLSSAEVAEVVDCKESTVRNHLFNARKLLRAELVKRYPEYAPRAAQAATS